MLGINQKKKFGLKSVGLSLLFLSMTNWCFAASPRASVQKGNTAYEKNDFAKAVQQYKQALEKNPENDIINYNLGTAFYKTGNYSDANTHLQKSLLTEDKELKEKTHYNLGNTLYKMGIASEKENIDTAIQSLERALEQYKEALSIVEEDKDAKYNYDYVQKELQRLKKKKQQQKQQSKSSKDKKENQNQKESEKQKQSQQQKEQEKQNKPNQQPGDQNKPENTKQEQDQEKQKSEEKKEENGKDQEQKQAGATQEQQQKTEQNKNKNSAQQPINDKELSPKEATMLLNSYEQSEDPKQLLQFNQRQGRRPKVLKDW